MASTTKSILETGNEAVVVDVECHVTNGLPNIVIVGFANKAVEESKERIRGAFSTSKLELPRKRITINLAPADVPKDSTSFDLPIVVSILVASGLVSTALPASTLCIGEVGLDGTLRAVRGIIGKLLAGRSKGFEQFYIPAANMSQAKLVPGITLIPVDSLRNLYLDLCGTALLPRVLTSMTDTPMSQQVAYENDLMDVVGQPRAKRALEIAAAGGHNLLLRGAPGTGKSMLAKAMPSILPPLGTQEILEVTHIHSLANKNYDQIITHRPFRAPHHSASSISIIGGGQYPRPGEISMAHHGILFLDEFPEFSSAVIEALRQPLEDNMISVARARDSVEFPANFMLVATCNPCPCGFYGTEKPCTCMPHQISKYQRKLSGPILDRIDLHVDVNDIQHDSLLRGAEEEPSTMVRSRVIAAKQKQSGRYKDPTKSNAALSNRDIKKLLVISPDAEALLNQASRRLGISARSYMRTIKVAQTIADLNNSDSVELQHVSEALQYRGNTGSAT